MLGRLDVKIGADISSFTGEIKKASSTLNQFGNKVAGIGKIVSAGISTPLVAAAGLSVKAFDTQIQAEKRLEAALRSAGEFSQATLKDFKDFASGLQNVTTVGDESTLKLLQVAKSMGLTNEQAKRAAKNSIALSKSMGINEQSAIRYTAALEQGDSTMLNRYLPTLRQVEDDSERAAKAQELLGQMFGAATAEAQNGLGPLIQIKNTFGDFQEEIGKIVLEYMKPFIEGLKNLVDEFKNSSKETKTFITQVMLIGSIAGPAIVTLGLALKGLALAFAMLTSPVTLVIAAIATLAAGFIYAGYNFDAIKERFSDISWWKNSILDMAAFFAANMPLLGGGKVMAGNLLAMKTPIEETKTEFMSLGDTAKAIFADITGLDFDKVFTIKDPEVEVDSEAIADKVAPIKPKVEIEAPDEGIIDLGLDELGADLDGFVNSFNLGIEGIITKSEALRMKWQSVQRSIQGALSQVLNSSLNAFTQSLFNAGQYSTQELELRKISLQKQRDALKESLAQQEISQREYALRISLLNQELLDTETEINEARKNNFQQAMDAMTDAAGQAIRAILAEFAKLAIIKGLLALLGAPTGGVGKFFKGTLENMLPSGRARGGPVFSNTPYIVGERGPELFMPNRSGSIVPNGQLMGKGAAMGAQAINLNGEFRIKGTDLVLTLNEANYRLGR
jgi:hypothetical protein